MRAWGAHYNTTTHQHCKQQAPKLPLLPQNLRPRVGTAALAAPGHPTTQPPRCLPDVPLTGRVKHLRSHLPCLPRPQLQALHHKFILAVCSIRKVAGQGGRGGAGHALVSAGSWDRWSSAHGAGSCCSAAGEGCHLCNSCNGVRMCPTAVKNSLLSQMPLFACLRCPPAQRT